MRARTLKIGALGASLGLALMASAIVPASASAPVPSALTSPTTCSAFAGTATGSSYSANGVSLRAGDSITAAVSPGRSTDTIFLTASAGLNLIFAEGPTTGFTFTAPATSVYNLSWSYRTSSTVPTGLTWTFTSKCSTAVSPTPTPTATTKPGKGRK